MRFALLGSVSFSRVALEGLVRNGATVVGVGGLSVSRSASVSDYARLDDIARDAGAEYMDFDDVNEPPMVEAVRRWQPDVLFVVGLSQLVKNELMSSVSRGCIGFHPTELPKGRGRAPVAWMTFDGTPGAATFFVLVQEADAGAIFVQEPFDVGPRAYAMDTIVAVREAISRALDRWLPRLLAGEWNPIPQDESAATFFGKRAADDGLINWHDSAEQIERLVRTASRPYPGAFTHTRDARVTIWRASVERASPFRGVVGRILSNDDGVLRVQTGEGVVIVEEFEIVRNELPPPKLSVGLKFSTIATHELATLRRRIESLERQLAAPRADA